GRIYRLCMGSVGEQSQGQVLQAHAIGPEATKEGNAGVGADDRDPRAIPLSQGGLGMKRLRVWILRLAGLFSGERRERELAEEIESHLQMHIEDNLRSGMTPEQARRDAIRKLGGVELTKQAYRDGGRIPFLENLPEDPRFAIRQLGKNPGFTGAAIFVLALGVCASVAIFTFVDATLIKPLPYQNPGRLVGVYESIQMFPRSNLSYLDYLDSKKLNKVFSSLDVYNGPRFILHTPARA